MSDLPLLHWTEDDQPHAARWLSGADHPAPRRVVVADDTLAADRAYRLVCEGTGLLWRGDFQNARQLLQALGRRIDRRPQKPSAKPPLKPNPAPATDALTQAHHLHRKAQAERARILGLVLIPLEAGFHVPLRRAPDVVQTCAEVFGAGEADADAVISLRELQGLIGAHEWRKKGVPVPALGASIHPHYGVFSPVRGEYLDLVRDAPLPAALLSAGLPHAQRQAWDIGAGTGVLAALLARRGVPHVVATELAPRALACAQDNLQRLGLAARVTLLQTDLFPPGQAALIVCNPPWLPGKPSSAVEQGVYDPDSRMLKGFLAGLAAHLAPGGEGWLILSDLAEHLGLRRREELLGWIASAGLAVAGRLDTRPRHRKAHDADDPLHAARSAEVTSLWRLVRAA